MSLLLLFGAFEAVTSKRDCLQSVTTSSGHTAPSRICSGDLIFNEEFDTFNLKTWQHELTLAGGGVSMKE